MNRLKERRKKKKKKKKTKKRKNKKIRPGRGGLGAQQGGFLSRTEKCVGRIPVIRRAGKRQLREGLPPRIPFVEEVRVFGRGRNRERTTAMGKNITKHLGVRAMELNGGVEGSDQYNATTKTVKKEIKTNDVIRGAASGRGKAPVLSEKKKKGKARLRARGEKGVTLGGGGNNSGLPDTYIRGVLAKGTAPHWLQK